MDENHLVQLHQWAKALHDEIRMMFGPEGDDDIAEVQCFAAVAVTVGLVWARELSGEDEARAIRLISYSFCKALSDQWHRPLEDAAALYQERYSEYAPLVAANFQKPSFAMMDALDKHVMGEAARDRERQKHLSNLVIVASGMLGQIGDGQGRDN